MPHDHSREGADEADTSKRKYLGAGGAGVHPLYRLDGGRCILMDTGLAQEREELSRPCWTTALLRRASCAPTPM